MRSNIGTVESSWTAVALLALWALTAWFLLRPESIVVDREGWRQADTQQIAINGLLPEARFNVPMVNWGGTKPTPVEAEFQLYTTMVRGVFRAIGDVAEWPGQAISIMAITLAGGLLFWWLRLRYGTTAALAGLATFLISRAALFLGTSVQPDAFGLAWFITAWIGFDLWLEEAGAGHWTWWVVATTLSCLVKPTNLQIGIAQFLVVCLSQRRVLKMPALWVGWAIVLAANVAQFWHGAQIHNATGLSFGVVSGGDSKFPPLGDLLQPGKYLALFEVSAVWGLGPLGLAALAVAAVRRSLPPWLWALGIAHVIALLTALNYTASGWWGTYYHSVANFIGAVLVAHVIRGELDRSVASATRLRLVTGVASVALVAVLSWNVYDRFTLGRTDEDQAYVQLADHARKIIPPTSPLLVRTDAVPYIRTSESSRLIRHNHEDPRMLYLLNQCGWALWPTAELEVLIEFREKGVEWLIEPHRYRGSAEHESWLAENAELMIDKPEGRIWHLR